MTRINGDIKTIPKVDLKDKKIISLLAQNSRLSFSEIAKKVLLSRDAVRYRIERLEKLGVIERFFPIINYDILGKKVFHIYMQTDMMSDETKEKFYAYLESIKNVISVIEYSDKWDLEIIVIANNSEQIDSIMDNIINNFNDGMGEIEVMETVKEIHKEFVPKDIIKLIEINEKQVKKLDEVKLDDVDIGLLKELCINCRNSAVYYAEKLKVSQDTINYRIERMIKSNVIEGFTTAVNYSLLGYHFYIVFLSMRTIFSKDLQRLKEFASLNENILFLEKTIGEYNFLMGITAKTQADFHKILQDLRRDFRTSIKDMDTLVSYKEIKFDIFSEI